MRDAMIFRGPDGCGYADGPGFAIGHGRLSIIDLSNAGQQPIWNGDRGVAVVFNGEIYNSLELRPQLLRSRHRFASRTDSEVLVHGYEEWGIAGLLRRIRGVYAFAITCSAKERGWGYVAENEDLQFVASRLQELVAGPALRNRVVSGALEEARRRNPCPWADRILHYVVGLSSCGKTFGYRMGESL